MGDKVYTYILKDKELDIYKIGKTTNPLSRFNKLCKKGEIVPIAIVGKDVEKTLHDMYGDNRMFVNHKAESGKTEWFKKGGTLFNEFIEKIDTGKTIPYLSTHKLIVAMEKIHNFIILTPSVNWEFERLKFSRYVLGMKFLELIGIVNTLETRFIKLNVKKGFEGDVKVYNKRMMLSEDLFNDLVDKYKIFLGNKESIATLERKGEDLGISTVNLGQSKEVTFYLRIFKVI